MTIDPKPTRKGMVSRSLRQGESFIDLLKLGLKRDIGPSFERAWSEAQKGSYGRLAVKVGGTALGSYMIADGVYNLIGGFDEQVDDLFIKGTEGRNMTRMFVGSTEILAGAAGLYMALTKGTDKLALK